MTEDEIKRIVTKYIYQAFEGMSKENNKFDFKKSWYNLKEDLEVNEFLKDISAMVNTPGPDGFIVIGFDDKSKEYNPSIFLDSKLKDKNEIPGILIRRIDHAFDINIYDIKIDENKLSVIHIPPSYSKPHFLKNYKSKSNKEEQHRIFVRNDTTTKIAGRIDLERMLWDNKNVEPEYGIEMSVNKSSMVFNTTTNTYGNFELTLSGLVVENIGKRNLGIGKLEFSLKFKESCGLDELIFAHAKVKFAEVYSEIKHSKMIIKPYSIEQFKLKLYTNYNFGDDYSDRQKYNGNRVNIEQLIANVTLSNNKNVSIDVILND